MRVCFELDLVYLTLKFFTFVTSQWCSADACTLLLYLTQINCSMHLIHQTHIQCPSLAPMPNPNETPYATSAPNPNPMYLPNLIPNPTPLQYAPYTSGPVSMLPPNHVPTSNAKTSQSSEKDVTNYCVVIY